MWHICVKAQTHETAEIDVHELIFSTEEEALDIYIGDDFEE